MPNKVLGFKSYRYVIFLRNFLLLPIISNSSFFMSVVERLIIANMGLNFYPSSCFFIF